MTTLRFISLIGLLLVAFESNGASVCENSRNLLKIILDFIPLFLLPFLLYIYQLLLLFSVNEIFTVYDFHKFTQYMFFRRTFTVFIMTISH